VLAPLCQLPAGQGRLVVATHMLGPFVSADSGGEASEAAYSGSGPAPIISAAQFRFFLQLLGKR